jgi:hypothetical protein
MVALRTWGSPGDEDYVTRIRLLAIRTPADLKLLAGTGGPIDGAFAP